MDMRIDEGRGQEAAFGIELRPTVCGDRSNWSNRHDSVAVDEDVREVDGTAERRMDARVPDEKSRRRHLHQRPDPEAVWRSASSRVKGCERSAVRLDRHRPDHPIRLVARQMADELKRAGAIEGDGRLTLGPGWDRDLRRSRSVD